MSVKSDIYDKLEELFGPACPAGYLSQAQDNWDKLAEAMALGAPGVGGLVSAAGMADGYLTFYTGSTTVAGDNDLYYDRVHNQLQLNSPLRIKSLSEKPTAVASYGLFYTKSNLPYFLSASGTEYLLTYESDLTGLTQTVQEIKDQHEQAIHHLRAASDGYGTSITNHLADTANPHTVTAAQVGNTTAQWNADKLHSRVVDFQAPSNREVLTWNAEREVWEPEPVNVADLYDPANILDGYQEQLDGLNNTELEHHVQHSEAIKHLRDAADAYGQGDTELEHYTQLGEAITTIRKDLDGYSITIDEHYNQHSEVLHQLREACDAYGQGATELEHYRQLGDAITTILKDLDGYNQTISEHYTQHSDAFDTVRKDLDGYNQTISEHYQQHSDAFDTIKKDLDGYNTTIQEHYEQHSDALNTIRKELDDGYADVHSAADGYIAFFTGSTSIAGDNDLVFNREENKLEVSKIKVTDNPTADHLLVSDAAGNAEWQSFDDVASYANVVVEYNNADDSDMCIVFDDYADDNIVREF